MERWIQMVVGQVRTLRKALEEKIEDKITSNDAIMTWMVRHSAWCLQRYHARHHISGLGDTIIEDDCVNLEKWSWRRFLRRP